MAALASLLLKSRAGLLSLQPTAGPVRYASKKAGGSTKNLGGKSPGRRYGFKKTDGWDGRNNTLYALEEGIVRFTKEVYIPPPRSPEATKVICRLPKGTVLYKTFVNVLPSKQEGHFKLVGMM